MQQIKFNNPLDNIRVAKPCPADWNAMIGTDRQRFCGECKLNVYNLSDMTRQEAEGFLLQSEGRTCVRYFRREDGTILTKDCPVGLAALKKRVSRAMTAVFSMIAGLFGGVFAFSLLKPEPVNYRTMGEMVTENPPRLAPPTRVEPEVTMGTPYIEVKGDVDQEAIAGGISNMDEVKGRIVRQNPKLQNNKK